MLNKVPEAENLSLMSQGLLPKVRPVNNGTDISKKIGRATIDSNNGKKINRRLHNQFQGRRKGCHKVSLIATAAYKNGKVITKNDKKNAFNEFSREGILQGVKKLWPDAYPMVYTYYGSISTPVFFLYRDSDNCLKLLVNFSSEGVKQGCTLGSICYGMGAEYNIYSHLRSSFEEVQICAITDDQIDIWDAPGVDGTQEDWDALYTKIAKFEKAARVLSTSVNLVDAVDKDGILIPEYGFLPTNSIIDGIQLNVTKEGFIIAGIPIGTPGFIDSITQKKVELNLHRLSLAKKFKNLHPQYLFNTIVKCISRSLDYFAGAVSTNAIIKHLVVFDEMMVNAVLELINCPVDLVRESKLTMSTTLLSLPTSAQGAGLIPASRKAPILYLDSIMEVSKEYSFRKNSLALIDDVTAAYSLLISYFNLPVVDRNHPLFNALPGSPMDTLQLASTRSAKATLLTQGKVKFVMKLLHGQLRIALLKDVMNLPASSDKIHYLTILTSSIYHKFLNVNLRIKFFHMDHEDYRFALSFFLCLPFPSGSHYNGTCMNEEYGYHLVNCSRCNLKVDANGDHAARCPNAFLG